MSWLEQKYINLLSPRLERFKRKSGVLWNFRCPICGDSETNKSKARGYIYLSKGEYVFHCHNCNDTKSFKNFLKMIDPNLHNEYAMDVLKEKAGSSNVQQEKVVIKMAPPVFNNDPLKKLKKISSLVNHSAKRYVVQRQIPTPYHAKLYYCDKFKAWVNSIIPNKFEIVYDEPRLVIPFINDKGDMIGFQGRSFKQDDKLRYITIMIDETQPRLYGLDALDTRDMIYVFEGPIDSMFIPNSIASAGGEIKRELPRLGLDKSAYTVVYDNEPRNVDTVKKMERAIDDGYAICIWPDTITKKDINDMVKAEVSDTSYVNTELVGRISNRIRKIIDQNTYSGLQAKLKLTQWRKC
jgi:hypothetical protein